MGGYGYGSKSASKVKGVQVLNPSFDARMLQIGSGSANNGSSKMDRGFAVSSNTLGGGSSVVGDLQTFGGKRGLVQFLYNPNTISVNLQANPSQPSASKMQSAADLMGSYDQASGVLMAGGIGSVSVDLLYDRTYEVNTKHSKNPASALGCHADVMAWYALLGVNTATSPTKTTYNYESDSLLTLLQEGPINAPHSSTSKTTTVANISPMNFLTWTEIGLVMGPLLRFTGIVNGLSVTYTHFTRDLVPIRCQVSLSMMLIPSQDKLLQGVFNDPNLSWTDTKKTPAAKPTPASKVDPTLGGILGAGGL